MPTYDYLCGSCGHQFEEFQSMSSDPLKKCPKCGKLKLQRLIGMGGGVIFKGAGFYQTDYKKSSPPTSDNSASKPTESKPEPAKKEKKKKD